MINSPKIYLVKVRFIIKSELNDNMKNLFNYLFTIISILFVLSLLAYLVYGTVPPKEPNELDIHNHSTNWSLDSEPIIYGKTIWSDFNDNINDSIKVYYVTYTGGFFHNFETMSWEIEPGNFSTRSLDYNTLSDKWDNSSSVFRFKFENDYYRVSFSIPKLENGLDKYDSLIESWEEHELHQIVEKW